MKLGLLVVVAVAVLLPSCSESRIVSRCELRDKLLKMIKVPRRLEERMLATIICEVDRRSHLDTSLVSVNRITTTTKPTMITAPSTTRASKLPTEAASIQPTSNNSTTTSTTTTMTTATSPATAKSTISSMNTTLVSNSTGGNKRQKREADSSSEEDGSQMEEEEETSSEEDAGNNMNPWSLGLYGLFQLCDKDFCDSGYHQSRNECHTSCTAFIDDDISDDIACVVNTGYWRQILESASDSCRRASNFFKECN